MAYYRICPYCGAHLDCCEKCDCQSEMAKDTEPPDNIDVRAVLMRREAKTSA